MTKVEQKAFEAYPDVEQKIYHGAFGTINFDRNAEKREGFIKGYQQAKKDLEVKEVDLEKELNSFLNNKEGHPRIWHSVEQMEWGKDIAKHFFELGLEAQKGVKDE